MKPEPLGLRSALTVSVFSWEDWRVFRKYGMTWKYTFSTRRDPEDPRVEFFTQHRESRCLRHEGGQILFLLCDLLLVNSASRGLASRTKSKENRATALDHFKQIFFLWKAVLRSWATLLPSFLCAMHAPSELPRFGVLFKLALNFWIKPCSCLSLLRSRDYRHTPPWPDLLMRGLYK